MMEAGARLKALVALYCGRHQNGSGSQRVVAVRMRSRISSAAGSMRSTGGEVFDLVPGTVIHAEVEEAFGACEAFG